MIPFGKAVFNAVCRRETDTKPPVFEKLDIKAPVMHKFMDMDIMLAESADIEKLADQAFYDIQFKLDTELALWLADAAAASTEASPENRVLEQLLENAKISARGIYPLCQDSGTAIVYAWKGSNIFVKGDEQAALEKGAKSAWERGRFRNSQILPFGKLEEKNSGNNLPVSIKIFSEDSDKYHFLFCAKGGGSANKTRLFQETKAVLRPDAMASFIKKAVESIGVSACPPYRIALAIGGQSPEESVMAASLASYGALDALPVQAEPGGSPYRDLELESVCLAAARNSGWGAQFGGIYMARDARVIMLPRHAASLPIALAVSCIAHRKAFAYISKDGCFLEKLVSGQELESITQKNASQKSCPKTESIKLELGRYGGDKLKKAIAKLKAGNMIELWGPVVLARDAVHARLLSMLQKAEPLPDWAYLPVFYAAPTEALPGRASGSLGPTTSRRMDSYLLDFAQHGIFPLSIGKGERAAECAEVYKKHGGAYLATVGGAAAVAAERYVKASAIIDWPELGMEAVRIVELSGLPCMVIMDSHGGNYYEALQK